MQISFKINTKELARLHYRSNKYNHNLILVEVNPEYRRQGLGKTLLTEFVAKVGSNKEVSGAIEHPETWKKLYDLGFIRKVAIRTHVYITQKKIIESLPVVKFLNSGGINVCEIILSQRPIEKILLGSDQESIDKTLSESPGEYTLYFKAVFKAFTA